MSEMVSPKEIVRRAKESLGIENTEMSPEEWSAVLVNVFSRVLGGMAEYGTPEEAVKAAMSATRLIARIFNVPDLSSVNTKEAVKRGILVPTTESSDEAAHAFNEAVKNCEKGEDAFTKVARGDWQ